MAQLMAAVELGNLIARESLGDRPRIDSARGAFTLLKSELGTEE
ncbi:MAG: hypothetical protein QF376_04360 [Anaerolineales bacterium]|nr:hypothetical protein [Anaerolineales bacterium]